MELDESISDIEYEASFRDVGVYSEEIGDFVYDYSDPYKNYQRLENTLKELSEYEIFSEDWMYEHKKHIEKYAEIIPQFRLSEQMEDEIYQKLVGELEWYLDQVVDGILKYDKIELNFYEDFIVTFMKIHKKVNELTDICDMFENM